MATTDVETHRHSRVAAGKTARQHPRNIHTPQGAHTRTPPAFDLLTQKSQQCNV